MSSWLTDLYGQFSKKASVFSNKQVSGIVCKKKYPLSVQFKPNKPIVVCELLRFPEVQGETRMNVYFGVKKSSSWSPSSSWPWAWSPQNILKISSHHTEFRCQEFKAVFALFQLLKFSNKQLEFGILIKYKCGNICNPFQTLVYNIIELYNIR